MCCFLRWLNFENLEQKKQDARTKSRAPYLNLKDSSAIHSDMPWLRNCLVGAEKNPAFRSFVGYRSFCLRVCCAIPFGSTCSNIGCSLSRCRHPNIYFLRCQCISWAGTMSTEIKLRYVRFVIGLAKANQSTVIYLVLNTMVKPWCNFVPTFNKPLDIIRVARSSAWFW